MQQDKEQLTPGDLIMCRAKSTSLTKGQSQLKWLCFSAFNFEPIALLTV